MVLSGDVLVQLATGPIPQRRQGGGIPLAATARGVGVVIEAEHLCMSLRGVRAMGARTVTSALRGVVRTDARTRDEFLALTRRSD